MSGDKKALAIIEKYAPEIIKEHEAAQSSANQAMQHAVAAGELLIAAKKKVDHGGWAEWVEKNCKFSARTASDYMRCAEHKKEIRSGAADSIRGAIAKLAKPKPKPKEAEEEANKQPASPPPRDHPPTEEEVSAQLAREFEEELSVWEDEGLDVDVIRERVVDLIKFKPDGVPKAAEKTLAKRGRPQGSKNKPKPEPTPAPATALGNGVDNDGSADAMKAKFEAAAGAQAAPQEHDDAPSVTPPLPGDLTIPESLMRRD